MADPRHLKFCHINNNVDDYVLAYLSATAWTTAADANAYTNAASLVSVKRNVLCGIYID